MVAYRNNVSIYSPDAVLHRIFQGADPAEAAACRAELAGLGDGPEGDRLRCLFERLVTLMQYCGYVHDGTLILSDGEPMDSAQIADLILWDRTRIEADLLKIEEAGLLTQEVWGSQR